MVVRFNLVILLSFVMMLFVSCGTSPNGSTNQENSSLQSQIDTKTTDLFISINEKEYESFSTNLDQDMSEKFTQEVFNDMCLNLLTHYGKYKSHYAINTEEIDHFISVQYEVKFELKDNVKVTLIYQPDEPNDISGLWIDGPEF